MSWFSELTSRAEAMLVKLDQDAAEALQNSDGLLSSKLLDKAKNTLSVDRNGNSTQPQETSSDIAQSIVSNTQVTTSPNATHDNGECASSEYTTSWTERVESKSVDSDSKRDKVEKATPTTELYKDDEILVKSKDDDLKDPRQERTDQRAAQFRLQTNSIRRPSALRRKPLTENQRPPTTLAQADAEDCPEKLVKLDADNIRASINRTLQEYSEYLPAALGQTSHSQLASNTSFFDQQPNLVSTSTTRTSHLNGNDHDSLRDIADRSNSFTIDVPDNRSCSNTSDAITVQLLKQGSLRKKSAQYIHRVINRLANQSSNGRDSLINDYMKIKFRRVQLRAASYARRLNYYFRAYPQMKYVMVGYLVAMQLLVVYVLFFYQSSSTKVGMTSQLNKQAGLAEPQQL